MTSSSNSNPCLKNMDPHDAEHIPSAEVQDVEVDIGFQVSSAVREPKWAGDNSVPSVSDGWTLLALFSTQAKGTCTVTGASS